MENAKSLNLQKAVSENPEKIHFEKRGRKRCVMGEEIGAFLSEVANRQSDIMKFVMELGEKRNRRLGVK